MHGVRRAAQEGPCVAGPTCSLVGNTQLRCCSADGAMGERNRSIQVHRKAGESSGSA